MESAQLFSGNWVIQVFSKDAAFSERFVIEGSLASDGAYAGETTTPPVSVSGPRWFLRFEWNDNAGSGWQPSDVRRTGASFTLQEGLVTFLGADDNFSQLRDHDFNDLVLRCRNLDPEINPRIPLTTPPDFTVPKGGWRRDGHASECPGRETPDRREARSIPHRSGSGDFLPAEEVLPILRESGIDFSVPRADIIDFLNNSEFTPYPAIADALLQLTEARPLRCFVPIDVIVFNYENTPGVKSPRERADVNVNLLRKNVVDGYNNQHGTTYRSFENLLR